MTRIWLVFIVSTVVTSTAAAAGDSPATGPNAPDPKDFKLVINLFGVQKAPVARAELVIRKGVSYQFITEDPEEVTIIDPRQSRLHLLDLKRQIQTEVTRKQLDDGLGRVRERVSDEIERQEKAGGKNNRVLAAISRDLIDPRFVEAFDGPSRRLRLSNAAVEIDALGEPEADPVRLSTIVECLGAIAKLSALREPDNMPPFARLDAFRALSSGHGLRPTEISVLYRLTGPPRRLRWTYQLVPSLTDREREAISQVDRMRTDRQVPDLRPVRGVGGETMSRTDRLTHGGRAPYP